MSDDAIGLGKTSPPPPNAYSTERLHRDLSAINLKVSEQYSLQKWRRRLKTKKMPCERQMQAVTPTQQLVSRGVRTLDRLCQGKQVWSAGPVSFELEQAHLLKCVSFPSKTKVSRPKARLVGANIAIKLVFRVVVTLSGRYYFSKKYLELLAKPQF